MFCPMTVPPWPPAAAACRVCASCRFGHETSLPAPHHRLGLAGSAHDLGRAAAVGHCKDGFGAPDMLLQRVAIGHNRLKPTAIVRRDLDRNSRSHHESLNCFGRFGNRPIELDH